MLRFKLILILSVAVILTACISNSSSISHFDDMIQGMWQPNLERRIVTFKGNDFEIERLFNVIEHEGTFLVNPIIDDIEHELSIHWKSEGEEGDMVFIKYIDGFENPAMLVRGLPFSENEVDTLHYIVNLNE